MTSEQFLLKYLTDNGLWEPEAKEVLAAHKEATSDPKEAISQFKYSVAVDHYPKEMYAAYILGLNRTALKWIEDNKPNHFAKPMFMPKSERDALFDTLKNPNEQQD